MSLAGCGIRVCALRGGYAARVSRRSILITGASSGLGAAMARAFAARGRDVALCARRVERLEELRAELARRCPRVRIAVAGLDVNDHERVPKVFAELRDRLGGIDRVIVNAGVGEGAPLGTGRVGVNKAIVETNLLAALVQIEATLEMFSDAGAGHLVLMSSVAAARGLPRGWAAYCAGKAGLRSLGESLRAEYANGPIRISVIEAGLIESEMTANLNSIMPVADRATGVNRLVAAIERERGRAVVPWWPWAPVQPVMRVVPSGLINRFV